jgi:hypothetical protein
VKPKKAKRIANRITRSLFRSGFGEANRLVLEVEKGKDAGGLCRAAVRNRIFDILTRK